MEGFEVAVTNLNFRTRVEDLEELFGRYGELVHCRVKINERNESKGFGFVSFRYERDASEAISKLNGFRMDGHNIDVQWSATQAKSGGNQMRRMAMRR